MKTVLKFYFTLGLLMGIFLIPQTLMAQVTEEWVARYNGPGNSIDYATIISVDTSGYVYATGYSWSGTSYDYATVKYDSSGNQMWVARYNGPGNSTDYANAISVDASGNVYVTGGSVGSGTNDDYATLKYDSNGNQQWVARYNGPGNSWDYAKAISVDTSGNVYVTGGSVGSGTNDDYATVKYDSNGNQVWVARYNGPGNGLDYARAISVDTSGNICVTGGSYGSGSSYDYATVKYDSNGNQTWVARYNGSGNSIDDAKVVSVDASGNIYITGSSYGSGSSYDYATVKYDSSGNQQWVARYNGPGNSGDDANAISVDTYGNVYVTGRSSGSGTSNDYATVKYDSSGNQQWVARYDGPGNGNDWATAISIDAFGNIYVTGWSVDSGTAVDYATLRYDSNGNQQWVARYNGTGNGYDWATAISIDAFGNIYVTGWSVDTVNGSDYATVKYNQDSDGDGWYSNIDCNDNNAAINPGASEMCNGVDDNCNSHIDEGVQNTYYADADSDTYGNPSSITQACTQPSGYVTNNTDCDDGNSMINPSVAEVCNGVDDNCNILIDEGVQNTYYQDADSDTYGNSSVTMQACTQPSGYATDDTDCDDGNTLVNPGAAEVCNGVDDNCNVLIDEGVQNTYYQDSDNDTYGNASTTTQACSPPSGYVSDDTDCDDGNSSIYPGALEVCNGADDNCNTQIDENVTYPYYADADSDGYGDPASITQACTQPTGYVSDNTDCNDNDNVTYPGAVEISNDGIDQDCNGYDLAVEALINGAGGKQQSHMVAWNPVVMEYLVVWQDFRNGSTNPDIYGVRLDAHGNVASADIPVVTHTAKQAGPWVAHGTYGGDYLAVWIDQRNMSTTGTDVYGAWISDGGTVNSEFVITNAPANQRAASVVYNPDADNFLVTWIDEANGASNTDVWGAIVNHGGGVSSGPFAMVSATGNQRGPFVRYDYGNSHYFMVWFDNRNGNYDVYSSRVSAAGAMLDGSGLVISGASGNQKNPRLADRDPLNGIGNYVLAWVDDRNGQKDIYGALVDGSGTNISGDFVIAGGVSAQVGVSVDVDWFNTKLAVVSWADDVSGADYDVYRAGVDQTGTVSAASVVAGQTTGAANNQQGPLVTYSEDNGSDNGFLFSWRDNRSGVDYDLYGIKVWP